MENVSFEQFKKMDLRVGEVKTADDIEGADRLYKLTVDIGEPEPRRIVAGIKQFYSKEELVGKKIVVLANLEPKELRGEVSYGMLLAASETEPKRIVVITADKEIKNGSGVS